jgi:hypothetical protein
MIDEIHDILMDGYITINQNSPLRGRLIIGQAAGLIRHNMKDSPELQDVYVILHSILKDLRKWPKHKEEILEDLSREIRVIWKLRNKKQAA